MGVSYSCEKDGRTAMCRIKNENKEHPIEGVITFHQCAPTHPVTVRFKLKGKEKATHAIHIHHYGQSKNNTCKELGLHFNPYGSPHGSMRYHTPRHMGDLINNIHFDWKGDFNFEYNDEILNLYNILEYSIIGRSVVIHAKEDDLGQGNNEESLISGNAGERIACAPIAWCENEHI